MQIQIPAHTPEEMIEKGNGYIQGRTQAERLIEKAKSIHSHVSPDF